MITTETVLEICNKTAELVFSMQKENTQLSDTKPITSALIYPNYRDKKGNSKPESRISEQETRFQFAHVIENYYKNIYYSVETPTERIYRFVNKSPKFSEDNLLDVEETLQGVEETLQGVEETLQGVEDALQVIEDPLKIDDNKKNGKFISAQVDLSMFSLDIDRKFLREWNIEFKAHHAEEFSINKDALKIFAESPNGLFFHTIVNTNTRTMPALYDKFEIAINQANTLSLKSQFYRNKFIIFYIIVLNPKGTTKQIIYEVIELDNLQNHLNNLKSKMI